MAESGQYKRLEDWVNYLLAQGKYAFSLNLLRSEFPQQTAAASKLALKRLVDKKSILSIHKGYYLIIPPQYRSRGILPPSIFLDDFMKELERHYYLALLNAAAYHGASHQKPQEFFVITSLPVMRPLRKKGLKINFISKNEIPSSLLDMRKSEAGYLKISNPVLTATDLIHFAKRVGGLNRVATVLSELVERIKPEDFNINVLQHVPVTALQRLGYLLDKVLDNHLLANALYTALEESKSPFFRIPLKASSPSKGYASDKRWNVIINTSIEPEL